MRIAPPEGPDPPAEIPEGIKMAVEGPPDDVPPETVGIIIEPRLPTLGEEEIRKAEPEG